ncbi:rod shape-determining protein MreD [Enterococcus columbae]|uniref:Rod shape-determining protein MreD n=1 Tax=Enterococcus columbae DSM 7374 = ATCC 51263 TaxID=1121865 RepID=S1NF73_9ENTE|nr:rod shape-determining protein MreD [Enterococcus columbae]EOT38629.1 rod shape-determining protein MreD [Enterococcus columbae DSM 7374 = ATCC 51263]EOW87720.1 rod shape-determining protein MreD [Enterococcus columbae DSM 7374 = ATCC 51263]OJG20499.1 rod shape-determining protein MreD [Enterococcus columbae DSM 7374 = ATCC 51263]
MEARQYPYWLIPLMFFLVLIDTHLGNWLSSLSHNDYIWNAHLVLITLLWAAYRLPKIPTIGLALGIGLVTDCYYLGIIGIYTVALPLMVWLIYILHATIYQNLYTMFFALVIFLTGYELFVFIIQVLFKLTSTDSVFFISRYLAPTLLLNIILFFALLLPYKKLFQ